MLFRTPTPLDPRILVGAISDAEMTRSMRRWRWQWRLRAVLTALAFLLGLAWFGFLAFVVVHFARKFW